MAYSSEKLREKLSAALAGRTLNRVLLLPPDATRTHSYAGVITRMLFSILDCKIDVMPALGTHEPMSKRECDDFLGIPFDTIINHDWRNDVVKLGEVPGDFVSSVSEGLVTSSVDVEVNRRLLDKSYDLIISVGQVVPHEVVGMANYSKNIFVGCGGSAMISASHMLGAYYGIERTLGRTDTPVRKVFDYAEENFIADLPILYILTVTQGLELCELFIGRSRKQFEDAAVLSREKNLTFVDKPLKKCFVNLDEHEFKSTWLGNKAIYRTRMAMADGGELVILAPGVTKFGEDKDIDALIRKYGYCGREKVIALSRANKDLQENLSAAAHMIHGSTDGRFTVTYAADKLSREEVEGVGFKYMPLDEARALKDTGDLYIENPAVGLWALKGSF
ncbi:MAG: lactate racemase domain-containing protein [Oscillospiraceae bacterium]|jgi:nickel-dependent lactate racemase|nr:lactate racemase domain-containing protein [Oscillospiraceae bacterium]